MLPKLSTHVHWLAEQVKKVEESEQAKRGQPESGAADASDVSAVDNKNDEGAGAEDMAIPTITTVPPSATQTKREAGEGDEDDEGIVVE